jgi:predicted MFS family arabinose efflux permease
MISGMAAGGVFPVSLALIGDLVPVAERQIALGRYLVMVISGNFLGAALAGAMADVVGWRGVFVALASCGVVALAAAQVGFRNTRAAGSVRRETAPVRVSLAAILANPRARICYSAVFFEGVAVLGLFPYIALMMFGAGETRATIAGLVLSSFALGGVVYSLCVRLLLRNFSQALLMAVGSGIAALALLCIGLAASWQVLMPVFAVMGFGFYSLHGSIQVQATELAPSSRGAAVSLHSFFFFLGQAAGPVCYGVGLARIGRLPTSAIAASVLLLVGLACAGFLGDRRLAS